MRNLISNILVVFCFLVVVLAIHGYVLSNMTVLIIAGALCVVTCTAADVFAGLMAKQDWKEYCKSYKMEIVTHDEEK